MDENNEKNLDKDFEYGTEWKELIEKYKALNNWYRKSIPTMKFTMETSLQTIVNKIKDITPSYKEYMEQYCVPISKIINQYIEKDKSIWSDKNFKVLNEWANTELKNYDLANVLKKYSEIINTIDFNVVNINSNGTIEFENENIEIKEETINEAFKTLKNIEKNTSDIKNNIIIKKPIIIIIIVFIINGIASGFLNKCGETIFELVPKAYNNYIRENVDNNKESFIKNFRIVNAGVLNVREEPSSEAKLIGKLYLNQCVNVLEKVNYWTRIKYTNKEKNIEIVGWVYSRYLLYIDEETSSLIEE